MQSYLYDSNIISCKVPARNLRIHFNISANGTIVRHMTMHPHLIHYTLKLTLLLYPCYINIDSNHPRYVFKPITNAIMVNLSTIFFLLSIS